MQLQARPVVFVPQPAVPSASQQLAADSVDLRQVRQPGAPQRRPIVLAGIAVSTDSSRATCSAARAATVY